MYRILVWGTGRWSCNLLSVLPDNCLIEAFIETVPKRKTFYGHKVISLIDYEKYTEETDFTILATSYYEEILKELKRKIVTCAGFSIVWIMNRLKIGCKVQMT